MQLGKKDDSMCHGKGGRGDGGLAKAVSGGGKERDNEKEGQCESENV